MASKAKASAVDDKSTRQEQMMIKVKSVLVHSIVLALGHRFLAFCQDSSLAGYLF